MTPRKQPPKRGKKPKLATPPNPVGRPTAYRPEYVAEAERFAMLGATDAEMADHFGVVASTFYAWKLQYPEFAEAIKRGKRPADAEISLALFHRAKGFEYDEAVPMKVKEVIYADGKRVKEIERIDVTMVHKVVPPDTAACIFWLKNRRPDDWKDKQTVDTTPPGELTPETRRERVLTLLKGAKERRAQAIGA